MFCLSDLLSELLDDRQGNFAAKRRVAISTDALVPELIDGNMDGPKMALLTCRDVLVNVATAQQPLCLHVSAPKAHSNICSLLFEFVFQSNESLIEIDQRLQEVQAGFDQFGALVDICQPGHDKFLVSIEINFSAVLPSRNVSLPSWLYGRPTMLIDRPNSLKKAQTEIVLREAGAKVEHSIWCASQTIDMLIKSYREGTFSMACVIDLDSPGIQYKEILETVERFCASGLLSSHVELLLLVPPLAHKLIPTKLLNIGGYKIIKTPMTMHRLLNPKSTLMQPNLLRMENYLSKIKEKTDVLLVDDCDLTRRLVKNFFEDNGFGIIESATGRDAIKIAQSKNFDAVLMDLQLPDMSGFDLARVFKSEGMLTPAPIIGITASRDLADYQRCFDVGMADCVGKPLYFTDLMSRIRGWMALNQTSAIAA